MSRGQRRSRAAGYGGAPARSRSDHVGSPEDPPCGPGGRQQPADGAAGAGRLVVPVRQGRPCGSAERQPPPPTTRLRPGRPAASAAAPRRASGAATSAAVEEAARPWLLLPAPLLRGDHRGRAGGARRGGRRRAVPSSRPQGAAVLGGPPLRVRVPGRPVDGDGAGEVRRDGDGGEPELADRHPVRARVQPRGVVPVVPPGARRAAGLLPGPPQHHGAAAGAGRGGAAGHRRRVRVAGRAADGRRAARVPRRRPRARRGRQLQALEGHLQGALRPRRRQAHGRQ